ncbi:hypothetical protein BCEP4_410032 [Burkholderia cepacia]|nr:hypothetical protein BCEP4_410032 [Burkholderia cepacia]
MMGGNRNETRCRVARQAEMKKARIDNAVDAGSIYFRRFASWGRLEVLLACPAATLGRRNAQDTYSCPWLVRNSS